MPKDIRSYFPVLPKKNGTSESKAAPSTTTTTRTPVVKKKPKKLDSDDEDVIDATPPVKQVKQQKLASKKIHVLSDSDEESPKKKIRPSPRKEKLQPAKLEDVFPNTPVQQSKIPELPKQPPKETVSKPTKKRGKNKNKYTELGIHGDDDFDKTLMDLDEEELLKKAEEERKKKSEQETVEKSSRMGSESPKKSKKPVNEQAETPKNTETLKNTETPKEDEQNTSSSKKRQRKDSGSESKEKKTPKKAKLEHSDSGIDPDQEKFEKKRYSAMLYQQYLSRGPPKHHGQKEIPKGKPDCLSGLTFLRTGVLDSLEGEEFNNLITSHGGRVVNGVSKKVDYVVVGEGAGPSKLEKARNYNIPEIDEDQVFDLILEKSGKPKKYKKQEPSKSGSEDFGIVEDLATPEKSPERKEVKMEREEVKNKREEEVEMEENTKIEVNNDLPLTEKYKPITTKNIIGQQSENSNLNKLKRWLENWHKNQEPSVKKTLSRPSPWASTSNDGSYFKAALLSGPPGVGKTTTATLICKELGIDVVEFNASSTRNKKLLQQEVGTLLSSQSLANFVKNGGAPTKKHVLIMDEVDGMAGNEDRGGMQELINLIKSSRVPIICMCNDRNHPKIRSLVNYCFDLRFSKPKMEQIRGGMMSICYREGIKINPNALAEIIQGTGCDVRQTLNHLAMWTASNKNVTYEVAKKEAELAKKDTVLGQWEVCRMVFDENAQKNMSLVDKARLFFFDYSIGPLFVQENYLKVLPTGADKKEALKRAALAAQSISLGDIVSSTIRGENNWALLESQAFFSSVIPGHQMCGQFKKSIDFPGWLGQNSKQKKLKRLVGELHTHTKALIPSNKLAFSLDYIVPLTESILLPLKTKGIGGIAESIEIMQTYGLLREDLDSLIELYMMRKKGTKNPMADIETKVKIAFTKAYNKNVPLLPYASKGGSVKKKMRRDDFLDDEEEALYDASDEEKQDDNLELDAFIKKKKTTAEKSTKKKEAASTSTKGKGKGKGKKK